MASLEYQLCYKLILRVSSRSLNLLVQNLSVEFPQCNVIWAVKNPCTFWEKCVFYLYSRGLLYWRNGTLWGNSGIEGFLPGSKRPLVELTHRTMTGILKFCQKIMRHLCLLNHGHLHTGQLSRHFFFWQVTSLRVNTWDPNCTLGSNYILSSLEVGHWVAQI